MTNINSLVACAFFALGYRLQARNLPGGLSALQFTRHHLDRLGIGQELTHIPWGSKTFKLPPSTLGDAAYFFKVRLTTA